MARGRPDWRARKDYLLSARAAKSPIAARAARHLPVRFGRSPLGDGRAPRTVVG